MVLRVAYVWRNVMNSFVIAAFKRMAECTPVSNALMKAAAAAISMAEVPNIPADMPNVLGLPLPNDGAYIVRAVGY